MRKRFHATFGLLLRSGVCAHQPNDYVADTIDNLTNRGARQPCSSSDVHSHPAHPATQYSSDHTEPLHQDRFSRAIAAMKQFSEALLCSTFAPDGDVKAKGPVQLELLIKCLL